MGLWKNYEGKRKPQKKKRQNRKKMNKVQKENNWDKEEI